MTNVELGSDRFWTKKYSSIIESYTPGIQLEPKQDIWQQCKSGTVYEIYGYVNGVLWHVFCEEMPQVEGGLFTFWFGDTKYFLSAADIHDMTVKVHRTKTFFKLETQDKETGWCTVRYWSTLSDKEES